MSSTDSPDHPGPGRSPPGGGPGQRLHHRTHVVRRSRGDSLTRNFPYCIPNARSDARTERKREGRCSWRRRHRRVCRGRTPQGGSGGAPHRERGAPPGHTQIRCAGAHSQGRFRRPPPRHRRPPPGRPGGPRLPGPQGEQLRRRGPHDRAAAARGHEHHRRAERHPVVVLPRAQGPLRGLPHRERRPCGSGHHRAAAGPRRRLRRLRRHRDRGAGRRPPPGGHPLLHRRAQRRVHRAVPELQPGGGGRRAEVPGGARPAPRHLDQTHGQHRLQPDQRAGPGHHGRDLPARRHQGAGRGP